MLEFQQKLIDSIEVGASNLTFVDNSNIAKAPIGGSGPAAGKYVTLVWRFGEANLFAKIYYSSDKEIWTSEDIPDLPSGTTNVGSMSVTVDSQGNIYILYNTNGPGNNFLYLKIKNSSGWQVDELIYTLPNTSGFFYDNPRDSLFVGSDDTVYTYVAFGANSNTGNPDGLKFVKRNGVNDYTITTLESDTATSFRPFIYLSNFDYSGGIYLISAQAFGTVDYKFRRFDGASWGSPVEMNLPADGNVVIFSAVIDANGIFHIWYRDFIGAGNVFFKYVYGSAGSWSTPDITPVDYGDGYDMEGGALSIDQAGIVQLVWTEYIYLMDDSYIANTYRQTRDSNGGSWSSKIFLNNFTDPTGNDFLEVSNLLYGRYPSSMLPESDFIGVFFGDITTDDFATEYYQFSLIYMEDIVLGPPTLNKIVVNDTTATLDWTPVVGATGYNIKYGTSPGGYDNTISVDATTLFTVTGLTNFIIYYFVVSAIVYIEGDNSNEQSGSPRPLFPGDIVFNNTNLADLEEYYASLLILQYRPKTKFIDMIKLVSNQSLIDGLFLQLQTAFILNQAVGEQLTIIGKIVGVPRNVFGINPNAQYFNFTRAITEPPSNGFNRATTPIDSMYFQRAHVNATYVLSDFELLALIKLKIIYNNTYSSFSALKNALYNTFGGAIDITSPDIGSGFFNFTRSQGEPPSLGFNRATTPDDPYHWLRAFEYTSLMQLNYTVKQPYYIVMTIAKFLNIVPHSSGVNQVITQI